MIDVNVQGFKEPGKISLQRSKGGWCLMSDSRNEVFPKVMARPQFAGTHQACRR